ncbi:hypothetical protein [Flavobacterium algicola]|uniref:hypothetical protein n=1 Tax=Flavobacterium algicola TaxID=556529 RepID=UPI001EFCB446|nr:hypothetical protein [Flavobacterium algicola]MCG9794098.1 hypothetical protein [Flavobacterium algicola]
MKFKLFTILLLFAAQMCIAQVVTGKIIFNTYGVSKVEVINATTRTLTVSDDNGDFSIAAKLNEELVFVSKDHNFKKIKVTADIINTNNVVIDIALIPEELKEVVVSNTPSVKLSGDRSWERGKVDTYALDKSTSALKVTGVNMGTTAGIDFARLGGKLIDLFKKNKKPRQEELPLSNFQEFAKASCSTSYFTKTLNLKPEEVMLFLEFCETDDESLEILNTNNKLSTMDFLYKKSLEFKKQ